MQLNQSQVADLADHFVTIFDSVVEYFNDPINQVAYKKWYQERYGGEPNKELVK